MHETATRLPSVGSEQSRSRPPLQASSHGGTLYPLAECSSLEGGNHQFSDRQCAVGPCPSSPPSDASENTQALPTSFTTPRLQNEGERGDPTVGQGLGYPKMDKNTRWQTNSTGQLKADGNEIQDEKQVHNSQSYPRVLGSGPLAYSRPTVLWIEEELPDNSKPEQYTSRILFYLSFLSPFLTLMICTYTILILAISIILMPLHLCTTRRPLRWQISDLLLPALDLQLRLIYSDCDTSLSARTPILVFVSVLSPIYAAVIAVAAWVAAFFWAYAAILGDPDGLGQPHDDGRAAVLRVRRWWERWLERSLNRRGPN